jgi:uncharacterized membrane protein
MEPRTVPIRHGWEWYADGWRLFMKNPVVWVLMTLILGVIVVVLQFIPLLGALAVALVVPVFMAGLVVTARNLREDRPVEITTLFDGFRDRGRLTPLLILGAIMLGAQIVMMLVGMLLVGGPMMAGAMMGGDMAQMAGLGIGAMFGSLVLMVMMLAIGAGLVFAVPLVMLRAEEPVAAVLRSLQGCVANLLPMLIFFILYGILAMIAMIPLFLGMLVLVPVATGGVYTAFTQIFPDEAAGASGPTST